jgi:predicted P-loop ATPase
VNYFDQSLHQNTNDKEAQNGHRPHFNSTVGDKSKHTFASDSPAGFCWQDELLWSSGSNNSSRRSVRPILANAITALRVAPEWQGVLAYDEFRNNVVTLKPTPWGALLKDGWTDQEDRLTAEWLQRRCIFVSVEIASQAVQTVAAQRRIHPVRQYLDRLEWGGRPRLDRWLSTYLGVEESSYSYGVGVRWMLSAVARIYRPGAKADCCLILEGPQGIKKSTALRTLADGYFTDELANLGSKDAAMQIRGVWIVEIWELDKPGAFRNCEHKSVHEPDHGPVPASLRQTSDRMPAAMCVCRYSEPYRVSA